jgi:formylglycine-generating enzyme
MRSRLVAALCVGAGLGASVACSAVLGIKEFTPGDAGDGGTAGDARSGTDGGGGTCTPAGDAAAGATSGVGCPCTQGGQLACNGNAQKQTLICNGGVWSLRSTCPAGQNCDSRFGGSAGTCATIDVTCMGAKPGQAVCSSPTTAVQCGPDLVSDTPLATCSDQACVNGACGGACVPNATQCSGDTLQTCGVDGKWHDAMTCAESCTDAGCGSFPSCTGGGDGTGSDCGGAGGDAGTNDCCASFPVSGGSFFRSYDGVSPGDTNPVYPATVSGFRLDAYEATLGRFRKFVAATANGWRPTAGSGKHAYLNGGAGLANVGGGDAGASEPGWLPSWNASLESDTGSWSSAFTGCPGATLTNNAGTSEHLPINCVTWYEAYAFCIWDGGFLPSEAEWNFAATGGSDQRVYPWSPPSTTADAGSSLTAIDCAHANYSPMGDAACVGGPDDVGSESPVGDGRFGQSDLAGNVWEWTLDSDAPYVTPCVDCSNVAPLGSPVTRGGSFGVSGPAVISSYRSPSLPDVRDNSVGVRCARSP